MTQATKRVKTPSQHQPEGTEPDAEGHREYLLYDSHIFLSSVQNGRIQRDGAESPGCLRLGCDGGMNGYVNEGMHGCACSNLSSVASVTSDSSRPHGLQPTRLLCPWDSPGRNTGVACHSLLQGDLPDPGIEPRSPALQGDS